MKLGKKLIRILIKLYQGHCRRVVTVGGTHRMDLMQNMDETRMCIVPNTVRIICSRVGEMYQTIGSRSRGGRRGKTGGGGGGVTICRRSCTASRKRGRSEKTSNSHK